MNQALIQQVIKNIKALLSEDKFEEALTLLKKYISPISNSLGNQIIQFSAQHARLERDRMGGIVADQSYQQSRNRLSFNLLSFTDTIPREIETQRMLGNFKDLYTTNSDESLEKIQGPENNLVPMSWIHKIIEVSKSVCQVLRNDGKKGTGWLLKDGWMMTNFHVIPNKEWISKSIITFNYERDLMGRNRTTSTYKLDPEGAIFSKIFEMDYAFIKVKENGEKPLSEWGYLEVDTFNEPQPGQAVNIIQHPLGKEKHIALTKNEVINVDGRKIFYKTDTEKGSSGSPVLNNEWKVIALHHAGKTEEEGGLVVNSETGEKMGANEGILIRDIMADIASKQS